MEKDTIFDTLFAKKENKKLYYEAGILVEVCEKLHELMAQNGFRNVDIAKKLEVSTSQISQWLDGAANMQLKTIADILFAMDLKFKTFEAEPIISQMAITAKQIVEGASKSEWSDSPESSRATHAAPISSSESNSNERMAAA